MTEGARRRTKGGKQRGREIRGEPGKWDVKWGCVGTRDRTTKPSRGWLWVVVRKPRLILAATVATANKVTTKPRSCCRGCDARRVSGGPSSPSLPTAKMMMVNSKAPLLAKKIIETEIRAGEKAGARMKGR